MLSARRLNEMKRGREALRHRLGENKSFTPSQLPDPAALSPFVTLGDYQEDPSRLGIALAESFFKLLRPESENYGIGVDGSDCWLYYYLDKMPDSEMRAGFLAHIETLLQLALLYPERLPAFVARLDALDNTALEEQATKALCFEELRPEAKAGFSFFGDDGGLFAGLTEGEL